MDPLTLMQLGSAGMSLFGGLKSLTQGSQDPYRWQREELRRLINEIRNQFPKLAESLRTRESVERGGMLRRISDVGAAGGLPRNVILQNIAGASLGSQRNLNEALANLDMQKINTLRSLAGIMGMTPPEAIDTSGEDLLSLGILGLQAFGLPQLNLGGGNLPQIQQMQTFRPRSLQGTRFNLPNAWAKRPMGY